MVAISHAGGVFFNLDQAITFFIDLAEEEKEEEEYKDGHRPAAVDDDKEMEVEESDASLDYSKGSEEPWACNL